MACSLGLVLGIYDFMQTNLSCHITSIGVCLCLHYKLYVGFKALSPVEGRADSREEMSSGGPSC